MHKLQIHALTVIGNSRTRPHILFVLLLLICQVHLGAQQGGIVPFASYDHSPFDSVNIAQGTVSLHIPLVSYPQRGHLPPLGIALVFNTPSWIYTQENPQCSGDVNGGGCASNDSVIFSNPNLRGGLVVTPSYSMDLFDDTGACTQQGCEICSNSLNCQFSLPSIKDATGAEHVLYNVATAAGVPTGTTSTIDGTGLLGVPSSPGSSIIVSIIDKDGISFNTGSPNAAPFMRDPSGNQVVYGGGGFTDSIGRQIPLFNVVNPASSSGPKPGCESHSFPAFNGATAPITICWSSYAVASGEIFPGAGASGSGTYVGISSVSLPNSESWQFGYDQWGSLSSVTMPSGAVVSYNYNAQTVAAPDPSGHCAGGCNYVRTLNNKSININGTLSTWTYNGVSNNASTQSVIDPAGNETDYEFGSSCGGPPCPMELSHTSYDSNHHLLQKVTTSYAYLGVVTPSASAARSTPYGQAASFPEILTTTLGDGEVSATCDVNDNNTNTSCAASQDAFDPAGLRYYDPNYKQFFPQSPQQQLFPLVVGSVVAHYNYDYAQGSPGGVLNSTSTAYRWQTDTAGNYLAAHLLNLVDTTSVADPNNNVQAKTQYGYDETANGSPAGALGNQTSLTSWLPTGTSPKSTTGYNTQGMPTVHYDAKTNSTTTLYDATGAYPKQINYPTTGATQHIEYFAYDQNTGLLSSHTDQNSQTTTYSFDTSNRPTGVTYPVGGGVETFTYNPTPPNDSMIHSKPIDGFQSLVETTMEDGLGRTVETQQSGPQTTYVDTHYDTSGRVYSVSNPYFKGDSIYNTVSTYDGLGRLALITDQDGSQRNWSYVGSTATFTDEVGNAWARTYDATKRLTQVVEPGSLTTNYIYDALNNLTSSVQHGTSGEQARSRSFTYDALSRLITSANPETGSICYGTQSSGACTNGYDANGNLLAKTDARGITVNYNYDTLNRLVSKTYSGSANGVDPTPSACFLYDAPPNGSVGNPVGRMVAEWTQAGSCDFSSGIPASALNWKSILNYDSMGRVLTEQQCAIAPCAAGTGAIGTLATTYNLMGDVTSSDNGAGTAGNFGFGVTSTYDSASHLSTVTSTWADASHPPLLFSALSSPGQSAYGPFGLTYSQLGIPASNQPPLLARNRSYDTRGRVVDDAYSSTIVTASSPTPAQTPGITAVFEENPIAQGVTGIVDAGCDQTCGSGTGGWTVDGNLIGGFTYSPSGSTLNPVPLPNTLTPGLHNFQISYQNSTTQQTFTSAVMPFNVVTNTLPQPTITASFENGPVPVGESGVLDISLSCTTNCGPGRGQFTVNGTFAGGFSLDENGTAVVYTANSLPVGQYSVVISWNGDGTQGAAQQTLTLNVQNPPIPTGTITATIAPFIGNPQGDVVDLPQGEYGIVMIQNACQTDCGGGQYFVDGNFEGGFVLDNSGSALVFIYPNYNGTAALGTHQLTIAFSGNDSWGPYTSPAIPFMVVDSSVLPIPPVTAAPVSSPVPAQTWSQVQISLGPNAAACDGTGQVLVDGQYSDSFFVQGDGTVVGNAGQYAQIRPVSAGAHTLTVTYWGTNSCAPSSLSFSFTAQ